MIESLRDPQKGINIKADMSFYFFFQRRQTDNIQHAKGFDYLAQISIYSLPVGWEERKIELYLRLNVIFFIFCYLYLYEFFNYVVHLGFYKYNHIYFYFSVACYCGLTPAKSWDHAAAHAVLPLPPRRLWRGGRKEGERETKKTLCVEIKTV